MSEHLTHELGMLDSLSAVDLYPKENCCSGIFPSELCNWKSYIISGATRQDLVVGSRGQKDVKKEEEMLSHPKNKQLYPWAHFLGMGVEVGFKTFPLFTPDMKSDSSFFWIVFSNKSASELNIKINKQQRHKDRNDLPTISTIALYLYIYIIWIKSIKLKLYQKNTSIIAPLKSPVP